MIKTTIIGNLGKDASIGTLQDGTQSINFSIGSNKKDKNGEKITTWVSCTRWVMPNGSTKIAEYLKKGTLVYLRGEISASIYENKPYLKMRVEEIQLLGAQKEEEKPQQYSQTTSNAVVEDPFASIDDVPF